MTTKFFNLDTDTTLGGENPQDYVVSSQKAIKTYADTKQTKFSVGTNLKFVSGVLPAGYAQLRYIEGTTNVQYINTGIVPTTSMNIYCMFGVSSIASSGSMSAFGSRSSNGGNDGVGVFVGSGNNTRIDSFYFSPTGTEYRWQLSNGAAVNDIYEARYRQNVLTLTRNGTGLGSHTFTGTATCNQPIYICGLNNGGVLQAGQWGCKIYRFTIDGICDLIPAKRMSDDSVGMYDVVNDVFYGNSGTGSFTAGPIVKIPADYQRVEYIQGNNNAQYINTGIVPTSSMEMYAKFQFVSVDASTPTQVAFFLGARDVSAISGIFFQEASATTSLDFFQSGTRWANSHTRAANDIVELKVKNALAQVFINGSSIGTNQFTPDETTQYPLFLNALNSIGQPFDSNVNVVNRIYRFTIAGVADMIPVRHKTTGAVGMYDVVRGQFFPNAGTGTFTAGDDVYDDLILNFTNISGFITARDLPTVYDSTITITQGGATKGTFTLNQSTPTTIALDSGSLPSDLDMGTL